MMPALDYIISSKATRIKKGRPISKVNPSIKKLVKMREKKGRKVLKSGGVESGRMS